MLNPTPELSKLLQRAEAGKGYTLISISTLRAAISFISYLLSMKRTQEPHWTRRHFWQLCEKHWPPGELELFPNLMRVIANYNGWHPIEPGEHMSVHFGGTEQYEIKRIK